MGGRDDFFKAVKGITPERIPFQLSLCEEKIAEFREKGISDYIEYFDVPFRYIDFLPSKKPNDYSLYFKNRVDFIDEWGLGHTKTEGYHFTKFISPMKKYEFPKQVYEYPMPDFLDDYRWEGYSQRVCELKEKDYITVNGGWNIDIFEPAWYLRGLEEMMMDFILDENMATACLDRAAKVKYALAEKYAKMGLDVIVYGDDVGAEHSMMLSPELWRKWLKPRLKNAIEAAKNINPDVLIYYHSDGNIKDIIPELIEVGVEILNPIQPECMDPKKIKKMYGDKLSFWGTIGTQTTMPFGTKDDVRSCVREMIEVVGENGGLIIAPTHLIEPDVPIENIIAFVDAVKEFGGYKK